MGGVEDVEVALCDDGGERAFAVDAVNDEHLEGVAESAVAECERAFLLAGEGGIAHETDVAAVVAGDFIGNVFVLTDELRVFTIGIPSADDHVLRIDGDGDERGLKYEEERSGVVIELEEGKSGSVDLPFQSEVAVRILLRCEHDTLAVVIIDNPKCGLVARERRVNIATDLKVVTARLVASRESEQHNGCCG